MNTRPEPLLVGGGDEGLKLGKEGCGKGVGRAYGMGNRMCRSPWEGMGAAIWEEPSKQECA